MDAVKNFAKTTVDGSYDDSATEIDVIGGPAFLPVPPFNAVWWNITDYPDPSDDPNVEIVRVTDITDDTLTITRAQEGTGASDHNAAGKTYALIAGMTARTIFEMVGDVFGSGTAILVNVDSEAIQLRQSGTRWIAQSESGTNIQEPLEATIGDLDGVNHGSFVNISDQNQRFTLALMDLATTQIEGATIAVGTLAGKLKITNEDGTVVRYIPLYSSIT